MHHTRVTKGTAARHSGWARRGRLHPRVLAALVAGDLPSESYARTICGWTDRLPEDCRDNADAILVSAAQMGMDLQDLAALAAEIEARSRPEVPDEDGPRFEDRAVKLETTFGGAGYLSRWDLADRPGGGRVGRDELLALAGARSPSRQIVSSSVTMCQGF